MTLATLLDKDNEEEPLNSPNQKNIDDLDLGLVKNTNSPKKRTATTQGSIGNSVTKKRKVETFERQDEKNEEEEDEEGHLSDKEEEDSGQSEGT